LDGRSWGDEDDGVASDQDLLKGPPSALQFMRGPDAVTQFAWFRRIRSGVVLYDGDTLVIDLDDIGED